VYNLGSADSRWKDLYLSGNTIDLGGTFLKRDEESGGIKIQSESGQAVDTNVRNLNASGYVDINGTRLARHVTGPLMVQTAAGEMESGMFKHVYVDGTVRASNLEILGDYVTLNTVTSNTEQVVVENAGTGPALKVTQTGVNSIAEFYDDGGVLALKIADGGNVGIGTATPLVRLHVQGSVQAQTQFLGQASDSVSAPAFSWSGDTNVGLYRPMADTLGVVTNGVERMRVDANGNVGIGTANPRSEFHITGTGALILPSGTSAQQPTGVFGMLRYNTELNKLQFYNPFGWFSIGGLTATGGNSIYDIGSYRVHVFTSSGTFTVVNGGEVEYLIVAGGGSGGYDDAGGGGAGGYLEGSLVISSSINQIIIGAGGALVSSSSANGNNGQNSSAIGLTAIGGGYGATQLNAGGNGGSGGGSGHATNGPTPLPGGTGVVGPPRQGYDGGRGLIIVPPYPGGGGGGAGGQGTDGSASQNGDGGIGKASSITGETKYYSGGGGGGLHSYINGRRSLGGQGGGGDGGVYAGVTVAATSGAQNTGGGGGGTGEGGSPPSGAGGSGIVVIRYRL
jgi:hypothetical protein